MRSTDRVVIAREQSESKHWFWAPLDLGELLEPYGDISPQTARAAFTLQAEAFAQAGADACIVKTMADLTEACLAVEAAVACGLPVIAQMSYEASGRTFMGVDPLQAASRLAEAGACVIGANCSVGPEQMLTVIKTLREHTPLPISALPNAGLPTVTGTVTQWPLKPTVRPMGIAATVARCLC